jgi:hypothetical protein
MCVCVCVCVCVFVFNKMPLIMLQKLDYSNLNSAVFWGDGRKAGEGDRIFQVLHKFPNS